MTDRASRSRRGRLRFCRGCMALHRTRRCWTSAAAQVASPRRCSRLCREDACWPSTRRPTWWRSRAGGWATARRCGARTCLTWTSKYPLTRSCRQRRFTGSPTTIACGRGWPRRCVQAGCSRSSAAEKATSPRSARSSRLSPARCPRAHRLLALGFCGAQRDRAAAAGGRLHGDPVLAGGAPHLSAGRRGVRADVDPRGAPCAPARGATRAVRRRRARRSAPAAGLCSPQRLRRPRIGLKRDRAGVLFVRGGDLTCSAP